MRLRALPLTTGCFCQAAMGNTRREASTRRTPLPHASGKIRWNPLPPLASQVQATKQLALPYYILLEVPILIMGEEGGVV